MCRHRTREDCPVAKCRFQHSTPPYIIYSSGLKGAAPPPPTPVTSPTVTHFPSTEQATLGWYGDGKVYTQHIRPSGENAVLAQGPRDLNGSATTPSGIFDANALAQGSTFHLSVFVTKSVFWGHRLILLQQQTDSRSIARGSKAKSRCKRLRSRP